MGRVSSIWITIAAGAALLVACSPDSTCPVRTFPYAASTPVEPTEIPVCPWIVDRYGCGTFEEMTLDDLARFCADLGDSLTRDEITPSTVDGTRLDYCYTCD